MNRRRFLGVAGGGVLAAAGCTDIEFSTSAGATEWADIEQLRVVVANDRQAQTEVELFVPDGRPNDDEALVDRSLSAGEDYELVYSAPGTESVETDPVVDVRAYALSETERSSTVYVETVDLSEASCTGVAVSVTVGESGLATGLDCTGTDTEDETAQ